MSNLEFTFEESVLNLFPEAGSGVVSAARFLAVMEEKTEEAAEV